MMATPREAIAFAPASVGNVGVGFDILGHTIQGPGDTVTVRRIPQPTVEIVSIHGCVINLPYEANHNTAGRALTMMRSLLNLPYGFEIEIEKGIALGSGMGGSAASCVAALVAANALLDKPLSQGALYPFALEGEAAASGGSHGDNVGPMLLGGLVLATTEHLIRINITKDISCVVVHPDFVLETRKARAVLNRHYSLHEFVEQSSNLALFLTGCLSGDLELIQEGLNDVLIEPRRAGLIPGFARVKQAALDHGALGASISGAGPSVFAWFRDPDSALKAATQMQAGFADAGLSSEVFVSPVAGPPAQLIACTT